MFCCWTGALFLTQSFHSQQWGSIWISNQNHPTLRQSKASGWSVSKTVLSQTSQLINWWPPKTAPSRSSSFTFSILLQIHPCEPTLDFWCSTVKVGLDDCPPAAYHLPIGSMKQHLVLDAMKWIVKHYCHCFLNLLGYHCTNFESRGQDLASWELTDLSWDFKPTFEDGLFHCHVQHPYFNDSPNKCCFVSLKQKKTPLKVL